MPDSTTAIGGFTRRNFIKGAAAVTAAGMLAGCSAQEGNMEEVAPEEPQEGQEEAAPAASPDVLYGGSCRGNCGGGCYLNIHVRNGQVVRTSARDLPDTAYNRICSRGATHVGRIYGSNRILYPMRRTGERGAGEFERISWDEAIAEIAEKWKAITDEYGLNAMCMLNGTGNYAMANGSTGLVTGRMANVCGMSTITYDVDAAVGFGVGKAGTNNGGLENELTDRINAKTIVCWGCSPTISLPHMMHFILEAKDNGTRYIVIDPVFNANASKADWWVPVKAGTDGALALSILNELFTNDMVDLEAVKQKSNAPFLIKEDGMFLRMSDLGVEPETIVDEATGIETVNDPEVVWDNATDGPVAWSEATDPAIEGITEVEGIAVHTAFEDMLEAIAKYPAETAAEICGLKPEDIKELARVYAEDGPVSTESMQGLNHYRNGHYAGWPVWLISIVTGNVGKPGASIGMPEEYLLQYAPTNFIVTLAMDAEGNMGNTGAPSINANSVLKAQAEGEYNGVPVQPKGIYITSGNPLCTFAEQNKTKQWLDAMDLIIVCDICFTDTANYADYVLPSAHWFEEEDINYVFGTHPYLTYQEKAVEPLGEAKTDYEIMQTIAGALGYGDFWTQTPEEFMRGVLDNNPVWDSVGVNFDRVKNEGAVRTYLEDCYIRDDSVYSTPTGKYYIYNETVNPAYFNGQEIDMSKERSLYWEECTFIGEHSDYRAEHPYQMFSEHMRTHTHSQWSDCGFVKDFEPEPMVRLNPDDAAAIGVQEGDLVHCYNTFGEVTMKCTISAGLRPGMASAGRSWNSEDFVAGHFASLPSSDYNQMTANQCYNDCAVKIEKA